MSYLPLVVRTSFRKIIPSLWPLNCRTFWRKFNILVRLYLAIINSTTDELKYVDPAAEVPEVVLIEIVSVESIGVVCRGLTKTRIWFSEV